VLVLDDGSDDGTAARFSLFISLPRTTPFRAAAGIPQNRGKALALNDGLQAARHPLIVTIDADTRIEPGSLTISSIICSATAGDRPRLQARCWWQMQKTA
jgi:biofilm PGA synthesis N-glycosyltransferase PgaC